MKPSLRILFAAGLVAAAVVVRAEPPAREFDEAPVPVKTVPPEYPDKLKRDGVSGVVSLMVTVTEDGKVTEASVAKSTHRDFEEPAIAAVKQWRFKPAKKDGKPVALTIRLPLQFAVKD